MFFTRYSLNHQNTSSLSQFAHRTGDKTNNGQKEKREGRVEEEGKGKKNKTGRRQNVYLNVFLIKCLLLLKNFTILQ